MAHYYDGIRVSKTWQTILTEAAHQVQFKLDDGQRTIAMQRQRVRDHGLYNAQTNPTGAAYPDENAPHIKHGAENHAIDVNSVFDGENHLQAWLAKNGVVAVNNVSTERWHLDPINIGQLVGLASRIEQRQRDRDRYPSIRVGSGTNRRTDVLHLQRTLRAVGYKSVKLTGQYDRRTRWAVARFKAHHQLKGGGQMVGKPFWVAIYKVTK